MTKQELAMMNPLDFAILIIQDRLSKMYKTDTPMGKKMMEAIDAIEEAKAFMEHR